MKTTWKLMTFIALALGLLIFACKKEKKQSTEPANHTAQQVINSLQEIPLSGKKAWLPPGSQKVDTGNGILITPASGWAYIGTGKDGRVVNIQEKPKTKITCTCNTSGGCKPFLATGPWWINQSILAPADRF